MWDRPCSIMNCNEANFSCFLEEDNRFAFDVNRPYSLSISTRVTPDEFLVAARRISNSTQFLFLP